MSKLIGHYLLSFFDSFNLGLIMPVLPPYILSLGGSHFLLGILLMLHNALQLLSTSLIPAIANSSSYKTALFLTLLIAMLSNFLLGILSIPLLVVLVRSVFCLTNQTQTLCKHFIPQIVPQEKVEDVYSIMNMLGVAGFVIGPIVSGHICDMDNGFFYTTLIAVLISIFSILLILNLEDHEKNEQTTMHWKQVFIESVKNDIKSGITNLKQSDINRNWRILFINCLYMTSLYIFFTKFALLLKVNFNASFTEIGYVVAYQSILLFCSNFLIPYINKRFYLDDRACFNRTIHGVTYLTITLMGLCYAPNYDIYLLLVIPMIISRTLLDAAWIDFYKYRSDKEVNLVKGVSVLNTLGSLIVPPIFGIFCDKYGHLAVRGVVILPLTGCLLLLLSHKKNFTLRRKKPSSSNKSKEKVKASE